MLLKKLKRNLWALEDYSDFKSPPFFYEWNINSYILKLINSAIKKWNKIIIILFPSSCKTFQYADFHFSPKGHDLEANIQHPTPLNALMTPSCH